MGSHRQILHRSGKFRSDLGSHAVDAWALHVSPVWVGLDFLLCMWTFKHPKIESKTQKKQNKNNSHCSWSPLARAKVHNNKVDATIAFILFLSVIKWNEHNCLTGNTRSFFSLPLHSLVQKVTIRKNLNHKGNGKRRLIYALQNTLWYRLLLKIFECHWGIICPSSLDKALSLFWGMPEMRCGLLRLLLKLKIALLVRIKEQSSVFSILLCYSWLRWRDTRYVVWFLQYLAMLRLS